MIAMRNIAAPDSESARRSKWMKSVITFCLLIALAGASVVIGCPDMGEPMADSCCSKVVAEGGDCPPELCIAPAPYVSTGSEPSADVGVTLVPVPMGEALIETRPFRPVPSTSLQAIPRSDVQALLQIFLI